jgi:ABC-type uncharacterized transport system permease subunit
MHPAVLGTAASVAYVIAALSVYGSLHTDYLAAERGARSKLMMLGSGFLAAGLHVLTMTELFDASGEMNVSFLNASSAAVLLIVLTLLFSALHKPVEKLGIVIFPLAVVVLLLKLGLPEKAHFLKDHSWPMRLHIFASMLAYSFLNIAALQAGLLAIQDWRLRTHHTSGFIRSLPPLQTMEKLLFHLIATGFALLSVSLLSGFLFLEDLFAQHLAHKTVLSLTAWGVFAVLLIGRYQRGWRGQTAIRWTVCGFVALMLAYFGSKMVLEVVLERV